MTGTPRRKIPKPISPRVHGMIDYGTSSCGRRRTGGPRYSESSPEPVRGTGHRVHRAVVDH